VTTTRQTTNEDKDQWRLKREISIPDLITFSAAVIAIVVAYATLDKRIVILEEQTRVASLTVTRQDEDYQRLVTRINEQFTRMQDKLDFIIQVLPKK
jgi:hypothetical protein